jgi:hypothetical protein
VIEGNYRQIIWEHSHVVVDDDGRVMTYCVYDAPNEDIVKQYSQDLGRHQIAGDVTPADFPA